MIRIVTLALLALTPTATPAAPGAEPSAAELDRARDLYRAGSRAYSRGRYDTAIEAFEEAYRLAPRPPVVFSLAQAHRLQHFVDGRLEHAARAVALYREYIDRVHAGGRRDHAVQHISVLTPRLPLHPEDADAPATPTARLIISSPADDALARLDDGEPASIPATFEVEPGPHRVHVTAPGHQPRTTETVALADGVVALDVELAPLPGRLTLDVPPETAVRVDGRLIGRAPLTAPLALPPGRHRIGLAAAGRIPAVHLVELERDRDAHLTADLEVSPQRIAAAGSLVVGAALVTAAGVTGALAYAAQEDAHAIGAAAAGQRPLTVAEAERRAELIDTRDTRRVTTGVLLGTGLVTAALGAVLWILDDPGGDPLDVRPAAPTPPIGLAAPW